MFRMLGTTKPKYPIKQFGKLNVMGRGEAYTGFWWGGLREGDHLGDPGVDGIILGGIFRKWVVGAWTGSSWLRIGTRGEHV